MNCPVGRGDKVTLQPIKATLEATMALTGWQARGGEAQPGDFDAAFRRLLNDGGLERWVADNEVGGGVDVLTAVAQGGTWRIKASRGKWNATASAWGMGVEISGAIGRENRAANLVRTPSKLGRGGVGDMRGRKPKPRYRPATSCPCTAKPAGTQVRDCCCAAADDCKEAQWWLSRK